MKLDAQFFVSRLMAALAFVVFLTVIYGLATIVRNGYTYPGEPANAYMVHMMESGYFQEQYMCHESDCVVFRTGGVHNFQTDVIVIDGKDYKRVSPAAYVPYSRGVYCPGAIDMTYCFELVVTQKDKGCPKALFYFDFEAPLVPDTCLVQK